MKHKIKATISKKQHFISYLIYIDFFEYMI
jgi:hypothetical protein